MNTPFALQAADILVDSNADTLANDGACTLREALDNNEFQTQLWSDCAGGNGVDRITIASGLSAIELTSTLQLKRPAEIVGPNNRQIIRPATGMTTRLLDVLPSADGNYTIRNLQLSGARYAYAGVFGQGRGAAMRVDSAFNDVHVRLQNLFFADNQVTAVDPSNISGGGAIYISLNAASSIKIEDSVFNNNRVEDSGSASYGHGGAILSVASNLTVERSLFTNNIAQVLTSGGEGGAIYSLGSQLTLRGSTFESNASNGGGSAISTRFANLLMFDSLVANNAASPAVDFFASNNGQPAFLVVGNSMFEGNTATPLRVGSYSQVSIVGSSFGNNQVADNVAAISAGAANLDIVSSTFADNTSNHGSDGVGATTAGIRLDGGSLQLNDSSLINNDTFASSGQGASGIEAMNANVSIRNSVLSNTQFGEGNLWRRGTTTVNMQHSLLTPPDSAGEINGSNSNNVFTAVAAFGSLGDYGCATKIGYLGDRCVKLRPHSSFATSIINTGNSSRPNDQRGAGFARDDGNGVDIGAFELQDPQVDLDTAQVALPEGNSGTTPFTFNLRRNGDLRGSTSVQWEVQGQGSHPVDAADFAAAALPFGSAFFAQDEAETTVTVQVAGDSNAEFDETFRLQLTQISGGLPGTRTSASGIVLNDDSSFGSVATLALTPVVINQPEGSTFYGTHRFRVTRTQDTSGFCSFTLTIQGASSDPIEQGDLFSGNLGVALPYQLAPGETTADLEVRIQADSEFEGDEQFAVSLGAPSGCVINQNAREVFSTVFNDDSLFSISAVDADRAEGNAGANPYRFRVDRSGTTQQAATISWSAVGSGAQPASADDFVGATLPSGQVSFPPGVLSVELTVQVAGDTAAEGDEDFRVQLGNPRNGGSIDPLADAASGRIRNDDSSPPPAGNRIFSNGFEGP
ncbi:Calx-beta domain-containing protein [Pseudomarimonas arenosa]|uniref:Calx-beta domain-containing protein n=1 Tax=Pseudomarimonas arenosa TaxID=2774145 RepID=A0AAW3ZQ75_9GAMM|nr:Calx-beta domain-containing protein [Pseudomarimonas arenosa]MBD8526466.1 hypothetical protein [Pseudomarimonas arenosa]